MPLYCTTTYYFCKKEKKMVRTVVFFPKMWLRYEKYSIFAEEKVKKPFLRHIEKVMECHAVELTLVNLANLPFVHSSAASGVRTRHRAWTVFANLMNKANARAYRSRLNKMSVPRSFLLPETKKTNLI